MSDNLDKPIMDINAEGLFTSIWGPAVWVSLHCITFNYPINPTTEDKKHYKSFFELLCYILPCCECRKHYTENIKEGPAMLTDEVFETRSTLTKWLYELHDLVNGKLGMKYDISYDDLCKKYNSYIAGCTVTEEQKIIAYKNSYDKESPIISYEMAKKFTKYAISRGLKNFSEELEKTNNIIRKSSEWICRNEKCWKIVKQMKINGIIGFEKEGTKYERLPSIAELHLIQQMSTSLREKVLLNMIKKLERVI